MRKYISGQRWALWRWTEVHINGSLYLRRLHLVQIPKVGALMLHWIYRPDAQPHLHDHPVSFLSVVLRGSYTELRALNGTEIKQRIRYANFVRATDSHRIIRTSSPYALTLVLAGPKRRNWGFHTQLGWIPWQEYKED